jgi:hypothetical protein
MAVALCLPQHKTHRTPVPVLLQVRLKLRTQLTGLRPVEVVLPRRGSGSMSAVTSRLVRCGASRGAQPSLNELPASSADPQDALKVGSGWGWGAAGTHAGAGGRML